MEFSAAFLIKRGSFLGLGSEVDVRRPVWRVHGMDDWTEEDEAAAAAALEKVEAAHELPVAFHASMVDRQAVELTVAHAARMSLDQVHRAVLAALGRQPAASIGAVGWRIPMGEYVGFLQALERNLTEFKVRGPPIRYVDAMARLQTASSGALNARQKLPAQVWQKLKDFQKEGVQFGLERSGCIMLCDSMGLGKTVQAAAIAACFREEWPVLVLCPTTLKENWKANFQKWLGHHPFVPESRIVVVNSSKDMPEKMTSSGKRNLNGDLRPRDPWDPIPAVDVVIVAYDLVPTTQKELMFCDFKVAIADESHLLKNRESRRFKACASVLAKARRRILVSGTPVLNRPSELYGQLSIVAPDIFNSFDEFSNRYCGGFINDHRAACELSELHVVLSAFMKRSIKDIALDLPPKRRLQVKIVPHNDSVCKLYETLKCETRNGQTASQIGRRREALMANLYRATGQSKLPGVIARLHTLLTHTATRKVLVFGLHLEVLDGLENALRKQNFTWIRIDGGTDAADRQSLVDRFQNESSVRVGLLSLTAAGVGITLTKADTVLFAELCWNPAILTQAEDRAHRIGRIGPLDVEYATSDNTIDDFMWPAIQKKLAIVHHCLDNAPGLAKSMDPEELAASISSQASRSVLLGVYTKVTKLSESC